ncbi:putative SH3 domain signaling protein [Rosellinia necatrix]|uniref:Putative SH3 domain signaling protein n=1 Tax=Rosellinia necatrix TaxID=77044 RepID=A0A1W2TNI7_ROSNE|nr:putative SH3 domain signaling protein [Rosellinia necatrix]
MQSMQRQFGRMLHKGPGDNAKVAVLLTDYEDVDRVLAKIIDAAKSWRESWISLSSTQLGVVAEYDGLWDPIVGASEGLGRQAAPTPQLQLEQTLRLKEVYTELKTDILEELEFIEARVVKPASSAREYLDPMRKTIKKRENKRLDYEKVQDKTTKLQRKPGKTPKDEASLAKLEAELARLSEDFHAADAHLRETLPPIVTAAFNIIPLLVDSVVALQNRLLGLYYTTLHNYCEEHGFPSPPPPMDEVIAVWSAGYEPAKREFESIACIATGKAVRQPMKLPDDPSLLDRGRLGPPSPSALMANGPRRSSSGLTSANGNSGPPRLNRIPSTTVLPLNPSPRAAPPSYIGGNLVPTDFTTASKLGQQFTPAASPNSLGSRPEYFGNRSPSISSTVTSTASINTTASTGFLSAAKKKPPPPPPPKRIMSNSLEQFVIAQYDFHGQGAGDLSFREGDKIKIIKKTDTLDDWWEGELGGIKGSFPANYCKTG